MLMIFIISSLLNSVTLDTGSTDTNPLPNIINIDNSSHKHEFNELSNYGDKFSDYKKLDEFYIKAEELNKKLHEYRNFDNESIKEKIYLSYIIINAPFEDRNPKTRETTYLLSKDFNIKQLASKSLREIMDYYNELPKNKRNKTLYDLCENLFIINSSKMKQEYNNLEQLSKKDLVFFSNSIKKEASNALSDDEFDYKKQDAVTNFVVALTKKDNLIHILNGEIKMKVSSEQQIMDILLKKYNKNKSLITKELKKIGYKTDNDIDNLLIRIYGTDTKKWFTNPFNN